VNGGLLPRPACASVSLAQLFAAHSPGPAVLDVQRFLFRAVLDVVRSVVEDGRSAGIGRTGWAVFTCPN
jgi:hypothetical protein